MSKEDIVDLRKLNYSWSKIAEMLGISRQTLYRLEEYNMSTCDFADILPHQLDAIVKEVKVQYLKDGEVMLKGHITFTSEGPLGLSYVLQFVLITITQF